MHKCNLENANILVFDNSDARYQSMIIVKSKENDIYMITANNVMKFNVSKISALELEKLNFSHTE